MRRSHLIPVLAALLAGACVSSPAPEAPAGSAGTVSPPGGPARTAALSFRTYPALAEFGVRILEAPEGAEVGPVASILAACGPGVLLQFSVSCSGPPDASGGMTRMEPSGEGFRYRIAFPRSGEYRVTLSARRRDDPVTAFRTVAEWDFRSTVKPGERIVLVPATPSAPASPAPGTASSPPPPRSEKEFRAALEAALSARDFPALRSFLGTLESGDSREKAAAWNALRAVLDATVEHEVPEALRRLKSAGMDPNLKDNFGSPLLFWAADTDRIEAAAWLLDQGARADARGRTGDGVFHVLADIFEEEPRAPAAWVRLLVSRGADPNARNQDGATALCWAAQSDGLHGLVAALVESGADVNIGDEEGNAPLSHATQHGARKNAEFLKAKGGRLYTYEFPAVNDAAACKAVLSGDPAAQAAVPKEDLSRMIARTALLVPATPLHLAAEQGSSATIRALAARKVDWNVPDRYGRSPLQLAVEAGRREAVDLLLESGADPNYEGRPGSAAFLAALSTRPDFAIRMLAKGRVPRPGREEMRAAVASGSLDLVKALDGKLTWTPEALFFAADAGYVEIAEYLASRTAPPTADPVRHVERARKNREAAREYRAKADSPPVVPRKTGGIALQRGAFPYVLEGWSPWARVDSVKLSDYPVGVYVPKDYDGRIPYGLVVSMTNAKSSSPFPRDFAPVLDRRRLIWIGFDPYNGLHTIRDANPAFCLAAVHAMMSYYNIDPGRVYIGGYSLGGQMTQATLSRYSWLFDGAFFINIPYYGEFQVSDPNWKYLRDLPVAIVEGDYDYNRAGAYASYQELRHAGYRNLHYAHEPLQGHRLISAAVFERIFHMIEGEAP